MGQALNLTGPSIAMAAPHVRADGGAAAQRITFAASLSGASTLPVSAGFALAVRRPGAPGPGPGPADAPHAGAERAAGALAFAPASAVLTWAPGEAGVREFTVDVTGGGGALADGALVATVVNATNADVDAQRASSAATARPAADLVAGFSVRPNQARARDASAIPAASAASSILIGVLQPFLVRPPLRVTCAGLA